MIADAAAHEQLIHLFHTGTRLEYKKGEPVVRAGDEPRGIYFIESGFVKAYAITKYGEANTLIVRKNNDIFPLIWAFTGLHRDITYEAMSDTVLWRIARSELLEFLRKNEHVMSAILELSIEAYRLHSERVMNLEYRTVKERVAMFLVTHAERFGKKTNEGIVIDAPIKRHDIASSINASRESASRELSALAQKGHISLENGEITILEMNSLQALL